MYFIRRKTGYLVLNHHALNKQFINYLCRIRIPYPGLKIPFIRERKMTLLGQDTGPSKGPRKSQK
jgi:hypothetical protein